MDKLEKQSFIRRTATNGEVMWSRHALAKLASETFSVTDIENALRLAEVIEDYPHLHQYLPDCLVLCFPFAVCRCIPWLPLTQSPPTF